MLEKKTERLRLEPYVPNLLLEDLQRSGNKRHRFSRHRGLICFLDVSGFTGFTNHLTESGSDGPETLTDILNLSFELITEEIYRCRGDVLKFAGDAIWAWFPELIDPGHLFAKIRSKFLKINREFDCLKDYPLDIHGGAEWGQFFLASFGEAELRLEVEPVGLPIITALKASDLADKGELVIGTALAEAVINRAELTLVETGFFKIRKKINTESIDPAAATMKLPGEVRSELLEPYIAESLLCRLKESARSHAIRSEFRKVTILFASFEYLARRPDRIETEEMKAFNEKISALFRVVRDHGGTIARIDPYGEGHKLLVLYGAPSRKQDDTLRAARTAIKLRELAENRFRIRLGLTEGPLFCGDTGTQRRKEYTVTGESVNLAARLMSAAGWGEILFDSALRQSLPENIVSTEVNIPLKGYTRDPEIHKLNGITETTAEQFTPFQLAGREKELDRLEEFRRDSAENKKRIGFLYGETGVGKTGLLAHFAQRIGGDNCLVINCRNAMLFGHAWLVRKLIGELYKANPEAKKSPLMQFIKDRMGSSWWPLLAEMVGIDAEENSWTKGLSPELKKEKGQELFGSLCAQLINSQITVIIDDFDRADEFSRNLIISLNDISKEIPLCMILSESAVPGTIPDEDSAIVLSPPSEEEWRDFLADSFESGKREDELIDDLLIRSDRNPYFIVEFIRKGMSDGAFHTNRVSGKLELRSENVLPEIPSKMEELQMSRFDSFPESDREFLKRAAVTGTSFGISTINRVYPGRGNIEPTLKRLVDQGILVHDAQKESYDFRNDSMREVIYGCLPHSARTDWHRRLASYFEEESSRAEPELRAYHHFRAGDWDRAFEGYLRAAENAIAGYALNSAYAHFEKCKTILESEQKRPSGDILYRYYRSLAMLYMIDGRFNETYPIYRAWRKTAAERGDREQQYRAVAKTGSLMWKQARYKSCRKVMDYLLERLELDRYPSVKSKVYAVLGELERRAGRFTESRRHCEKAAEIADRANDYQALADAWNNLGLALWGEGKLASAAGYFRKSLENAEQYYGKYSLAQSTNNLAIVYWEKGDFRAADDMLSRAHGIFRNIGDRRNEAYTAGNLSSIHRIAGKLKSARHLLMQADLVFERLEDEHAHSYVMGNIGDIDIIEGKLDKAERLYRNAANFADKVGDQELRAECEVRFGDLAFFKFDSTEAEKTYIRAGSLAEEIGSSEYSARSSLGLARLHIQNRNSAKALELIGEIKQKAAANSLIILGNEADFLMGEHSRIEHDRSRALEHYQKVLNYALDQNTFELILKCSVRILELEKTKTNPARTHLKNLAKYLTMENSPDIWQTLVNSAYFAHFGETLRSLGRP